MGTSPVRQSNPGRGHPVEPVAIIVPVLRRPWRVAPLLESIDSATPEPHRTLFVVNEDDTAELAALEQASAEFIVVEPHRRSYACKINDGYRATSEPLIFLAADDLHFRPDWCRRAQSLLTAAVHVVGTNDICNPRVMCGQHSTHTLVRRSYIEQRSGVVDERDTVLHEGYRHDWVDDEFIQTAMTRGVYAHAFDAIVEHLHPNNGKAPDDDTYRLGREVSRDGRRLFQRRQQLWRRERHATVITASYGGVDAALHPPAQQDMTVDWVCFTDNPGLTVPPPWRVVHVPARFEHPCLAAKVHKLTPDIDDNDVVWIDASMEITSKSFVRGALDARNDGIATFKHPRRDCIYTEADASLGDEGQDGKYADQPLLDQVASYRAEGHPEHGGLYACGVIAWDLANPKAVELGRAWFEECVNWSWQDQLSLPVVARRFQVSPGVFPVRQIERTGRGYLANRWLRIWAHTHADPAPGTPDENVPIDVSVIVPFDSKGCEHREAAHRYVTGWYRQQHPTWEIIEAGCDGDWSKGRALADGVARATHEVLVIADADSITEPEVLNEAVIRVAAGAPWVVPHKMVYRLSRAHTARVYAGRKPSTGGTSRSPYTGVLGGGITVLTRAAWNTVGGIDERFIGWGGEDLAFGWALETLCGPPVRLSAPLFHLWHPQEVKGAHRRGSPESEALAGRYKDARGNPEAMRVLITRDRELEGVC